MGETRDGRIVNAILELRAGEWDATTGEVVDGILVMRPAKRTRECCDEEPELVAHAEREPFRWELRCCRRCGRSYSIGPALPPVMVSPLSRAMIELYDAYRAAVISAGASDG